MTDDMNKLYENDALQKAFFLTKKMQSFQTAKKVKDMVYVNVSDFLVLPEDKHGM